MTYRQRGHVKSGLEEARDVESDTGDDHGQQVL